MQVSRELDYCIRAVVVLSAHEGEILSKRTIAEAFGIPVNFLALILPRLVKQGLVDSLPGPRGGYRLAKPAKLISVYDVIEAMDKSFALIYCQDESKKCEQNDRCPVTSMWGELQGNMEDYLKGVTFDGFAKNFKGA